MNIEISPRALPPSLAVPDLVRDTEPPKRPAWRDFVPGLVVVLLGTLAAGFLSDRFGAPLTLISLLIGLTLNFLSADKRLTLGLAFASGPLLRWGIVLVGVRITFSQVAALGPTALISVLCIVALTMGAGVLAARRLGYDTAFGALAGGAVAICGGSAAMALASTLGNKRIEQAQLTLVLVGISAMSATAMGLYPLLAHLLHMSDLKAGFLFGASIHEVAQALGAGYSYSNGAGQISAIVKLTRVALLAPVLAVVAAVLPRGEAGRGGPGLPWFVIGFFVLAGFNSAGAISPMIAAGLEQTATGFLAAAVTATGIRSPISHLLQGGPRPLIVILSASLAALGASVGASLLVIH